MKENIRNSIFLIGITIMSQVIWLLNNSQLFISILISIIMIIVTFIIARKINVANKKNLYILSAVVILAVIIINGIKIFDMIEILSTEEKMISILEEKKDNVKNKEEMKEMLQEVVGKQSVEEIEISRTYFVDSKAYKSIHNTNLSLFQSGIKYIEENKNVNLSTMKQNIDTYYNTLKNSYNGIGKNILEAITISLILDVLCIAIVLVCVNKRDY